MTPKPTTVSTIEDVHLDAELTAALEHIQLQTHENIWDIVRRLVRREAIALGAPIK